MFKLWIHHLGLHQWLYYARHGGLGRTCQVCGLNEHLNHEVPDQTSQPQSGAPFVKPTPAEQLSLKYEVFFTGRPWNYLL